MHSRFRTITLAIVLLFIKNNFSLTIENITIVKNNRNTSIMALTTTEVVLVLLLGVGLLVVIIVYMTTHKKSAYLATQNYTRGANLSGPGDVWLTCDPGSMIQVENATMVCHDPSDKNFENPNTDPFLSTGAFNPQTTVDLTDDMTSVCGGKVNCKYTLASSNDSLTCSPTGTTQLISTYTCVPSTK
jgi:hypothetical protein